MVILFIYRIQGGNIMSDLKLMNDLMGKKKTAVSLVGILIGGCLAALPIKQISLMGALLVLIAILFMTSNLLQGRVTNKTKEEVAPEYSKEYIINSAMVYWIVGLEAIVYSLIHWFASLSIIENRILATSFVLIVIVAAVASALNKEIIINRLKIQKLEEHN